MNNRAGVRRLNNAQTKRSRLHGRVSRGGEAARNVPGGSEGTR